MRASSGRLSSLRQRRSCWLRFVAVQESAGQSRPLHRNGDLARQAAGHGPADERRQAPDLGGVAGQPDVENFLAEVGERDRVVVEPGHELDRGPDIRRVIRGGAGGVAALVRPASGVTKDAPFGERADDAGVVRGQACERVVEPETQAGEVLLSLGQDASGDEEFADVEVCQTWGRPSSRSWVTSWCCAARPASIRAESLRRVQAMTALGDWAAPSCSASGWSWGWMVPSSSLRSTGEEAMFRSCAIPRCSPHHPPIRTTATKLLSARSPATVVS